MKKTTWIVLGIFLLLLAAFLIFQQGSEEPEEVVEITPQTTLQTLDDQDIFAVIYQTGSGENIRLEKIESLTWAVTTHPDGQVTAGNVEMILSNLSGVQPVAELSEISSLGELGLEPPKQTLVFEFEDGSTYKIAFGDLTAFNNGYYAKIDDGDVVVLSTGGITQIEAVFETIIHPPTPTPDVSETITPEPSSED